ncbi:MAG TPA: TetR/AcrR family transcriptional regulator [Roseiflexaceae bacterium]|nr:TetR/AcrR family transcriptional regulator [Roseiflexaceae bacterium]
MREKPSRQQRHADVKQAIVWAARALILEKGVEQLSLREIARRIGHSPAGLYEYFGNKEEIVAEVAAEAFAQLRLALERVPTGLPPAQRLVELGLAYVAFARQQPEQFLLIFSRLPSQRSSLEAPLSSNSPFALVRDAVQHATDTGAIVARAGYGVEEIGYSLWALAHGLAMLQQTHLRGFQADFTSADRRALEQFVAGLARE